MPLYEFSCQYCGRFDVLKRMSDPSPSTCPKCGRGDIARIYSHNFKPSVDSKWKDHYIPQLGKKYLDPYTKTTLNPASHFNSLNEVRECVKKRGQDLEL